MTSVPSGYFTTGTNTPTASTKRVAVDNQYLTADDYILTPEAIGMNITNTHVLYTSKQLDKIILRASSWVNRYCGRYFDTQTIDETKTGITIRPANPRLVTVNLQNAPYQSINSIYIQVLKWFIEIDTSSATGYLQDFPDYGYYKIVPMLSNSGAGVSSPLPAAIVDKTPLGILWTNYTFGFGKTMTAQTLFPGTTDGTQKTFQAPVGNRLWAPDQTSAVYLDAVAVATTDYVIDYPNGKITFATAPTTGKAITADFTTNETIPEDIRYAVQLLVTDMLARGLQNPMGLDSMNITSYNVSYGTSVIDRVKETLNPYKRNQFRFI